MSIRLLDTLQAGFLDGSGQPLANGTVTIYDAGTTNLRTVYQEYALTTAHANPIVLDDEGKATAYSDRRVKFVVRSAAGLTIDTIDNVGSAAADFLAASATGLAGDGLTAPGDGTIAFSPDGVTLETNSDQARIKDGGVTTAKLGDDAVTLAKAGSILGPSLIANLTVACSVATNALTIALKTEAGTDATTTDFATIGFRSATLTSGAYVHRTLTAAKSTTISSGSTAGHTSATEWPLYVYAIDAEAISPGAGIEVAWSTSPVDERYLQTTTAEGGAGAADSSTVLYATTARVSVPVRLIAVLLSTQTTAGTWAAIPTANSAPTQPSVGAIAQIRPVGTTAPVQGVAQSTSSGSFTTASASFVDVTNLSVTLTTRGRPVFVAIVHDGSASNALVGVDENSGVTANERIAIVRASTTISLFTLLASGATGAMNFRTLGSMFTIDLVAAGTYTYKVQILLGAGDLAYMSNVKLVAFEL